MENELIILLEKFLRQKAAPAETARLVELFDRPGSRDILDRYYEEKWESAPSEADADVHERMIAELRQRIASEKASKRVPLRIRISRISAAVLIPLLTLGAAYFYFDARFYKRSGDILMSVDVGQKANMTLPDGTRVWLNSASSLSYGNDYNRRKRTVRLEGEAYFEVEADRKRTFTVQAGGISVEALGTAFDVKAYPDDDNIITTLVEGMVRVSDAGSSHIMNPDEMLTYSKNEGKFIRDAHEDTGRLVAWRNNQLAFEQEKLGEIAKILERMYGVNIEFESEELREMRFSGKIRNNNLESILQLISVVSPILYSIEDSTVTIKANPREVHLYKRLQ